MYSAALDAYADRRCGAARARLIVVLDCRIGCARALVGRNGLRVGLQCAQERRYKPGKVTLCYAADGAAAIRAVKSKDSADYYGIVGEPAVSIAAVKNGLHLRAIAPLIEAASDVA